MLNCCVANMTFIMMLLLANSSQATVLCSEVFEFKNTSTSASDSAFVSELLADLNFKLSEDGKDKLTSTEVQADSPFYGQDIVSVTRILTRDHNIPWSHLVDSATAILTQKLQRQGGLETSDLVVYYEILSARLAGSEKALKVADELIRREPGKSDFVAKRIWSLIRAERIDEAIGELNQLIQRDGDIRWYDLKARAYNRLVNNLYDHVPSQYRANAKRERYKTLAEASRFEAATFYILNNLVHVSVKTSSRRRLINELDFLLDSLQKARKLAANADDSSTIEFRAAELYHKIGENDLALAHLDLSIELKKADADSWRAKFRRKILGDQRRTVRQPNRDRDDDIPDWQRDRANDGFGGFDQGSW